MPLRNEMLRYRLVVDAGRLQPKDHPLEAITLQVKAHLAQQMPEQLFRHKVLKLLFSEARITEATIAMMAKWQHLAMNRIYEDSGVFDGFVR
jgi:hypothetical protein